MSKTIVILDNTPPKRVEELRALLPEGFVLTNGTAQGDAHMKEIIAEADFAIAGQVAVSGEVLHAAKRLKLLHKWGVGVDNLDLETARALNIRVARTTGSNALAVAEFTIGLMLAAMRCIPYGHHMLQNGVWHGPSRLPVPTLLISGKTVGIIGLGAIGSNVAKLLRGFGCRILYAKRTRLSGQEEEALGVTHASLDEIFTQADILSLNCPLTSETANLIDMNVLKRMKRSAILVNVARGGVVVEEDLRTALKERIIQAAAMDVFSIEPLPAENPFLGIDNLVLTPHLAAVTADTFVPTVKRMFENIRRVSVGEPVPPLDLVV
ncbi:SerA Phosphoglycerate dehydrogenase and related dehydrogenases [Rhabdaerophilaceae bacterium]